MSFSSFKESVKGRIKTFKENVAKYKESGRRSELRGLKIAAKNADKEMDYLKEKNRYQKKIRAYESYRDKGVKKVKSPDLLSLSGLGDLGFGSPKKNKKRDDFLGGDLGI